MEFPTEHIGDYTFVTLSGKINWERARLLDQTINDLINHGHSKLVFLLDEVTFICSGGIGALLYNLNKLNKTGGALNLIYSNKYIRYTFETLGLHNFFGEYIFDSLDTFQEKRPGKENGPIHITK